MNAVDKAHEWREAMVALNRDTNRIPWTRIEWFVVAFIVSQSVGNIALLITALRGH